MGNVQSATKRTSVNATNEVLIFDGKSHCCHSALTDVKFALLRLLLTKNIQQIDILFWTYTVVIFSAIFAEIVVQFVIFFGVIKEKPRDVFL